MPAPRSPLPPAAGVKPRARRSLSCPKERSTRRHMALLAWRCVNHEPRHTPTVVLTDAGNGGRGSEGTAQWIKNSKLMFMQEPDSDNTPGTTMATRSQRGLRRQPWTARPRNFTSTSTCRLTACGPASLRGAMTRKPCPGRRKYCSLATGTAADSRPVASDTRSPTHGGRYTHLERAAADICR